MGLLFALVLSAAMAAVGTSFLSRKAPGLGPWERTGVGGALGLAFLGLLVFLAGLLPNGVTIALWLGPLILLALEARHLRKGLEGLPRGLGGRKVLLLAPFLILILAAVLAPSDMRDWDSLAYHFAVPKIWLQVGRIIAVPGIHHSNFPMTADMLYLYGLTVGGETGAKAFNLCWYLLGCAAVFGIARRWYGDSPNFGKAGWWALFAFAGCPVVLWEAGTGYIDIPHGLFAGLAVLYAADALRFADRKFWILSGLCLGFAMGTKHTGLQTLIAALAVAWTVAFLTRKKPDPADGQGFCPWRGTAILAGIAVLVAAPWYAKSIALTGSPVYPFFYKQLGGRDWDEWRTKIYTEEQKSFGVGTSPQALGHAVLGLAYQPGRYVNPDQTHGGGFPTGSIGFVAILAGLLWASSGRAEGRERAVLAVVGVGFVFWFFLSQQSRYLTSVVVPLGVLAGGAVARLTLGRVLAVGVVLQAAYSAAMLYMTQSVDQLRVVLGQIDREQYQTLTVPFYGPSKTINALQGDVKIALYDEVFGFYLDKPYFWANPGHSTLIPYESLADGNALAAEMRRLGFTHAYVNLALVDPEFRARWQAAMGDRPYADDERDALRQDPNLWWRYLFADAVRSGSIRPVATFPKGSDRPRSVLFSVER
ncbi:MAG: glycosyltransferase family 39 protein [Armatimonadetes bacterium]|nr:glycosyltransferase family 39 protein [Armatimonadota bacterium]